MGKPLLIMVYCTNKMGLRIITLVADKLVMCGIEDCIAKIRKLSQILQPSVRD